MHLVLRFSSNFDVLGEQFVSFFCGNGKSIRSIGKNNTDKVKSEEIKHLAEITVRELQLTANHLGKCVTMIKSNALEKDECKIVDGALWSGNNDIKVKAHRSVHWKRSGRCCQRLSLVYKRRERGIPNDNIRCLDFVVFFFSFCACFTVFYFTCLLVCDWQFVLYADGRIIIKRRPSKQTLITCIYERSTFTFE